jgi:hypothetical protein
VTYYTLKSHAAADRLGPLPCRQWEYLRKIIEEV